MYDKSFRIHMRIEVGFALYSTYKQILSYKIEGLGQNGKKEIIIKLMRNHDELFVEYFLKDLQRVDYIGPFDKLHGLELI